MEGGVKFGALVTVILKLLTLEWALAPFPLPCLRPR
jgi:hypothetical protein